MYRPDKIQESTVRQLLIFSFDASMSPYGVEHLVDTQTSVTGGSTQSHCLLLNGRGLASDLHLGKERLASLCSVERTIQSIREKHGVSWRMQSLSCQKDVA